MNPPNTPESAPPPPATPALPWGRWLAWGSLGLVVLGTAGFFGYRSFKTQRAVGLAEAGLDTLQVQAVAETPDAEQVRQAWDDVRAAYELRPHNPRVARATALASSLVEPEKALGFWQELVKLEATPANWAGLGLAALAQNDLESAREAAKSLANAPGAPWTAWELQARLAWHDRDLPTAFAAAEQALQAAPAGDGVWLLPLQIARQTPEATDDARAWELLGTSSAKQALAPNQLRSLAHLVQLSELDEVPWLLDALAASPERTPRMLRVAMLYQARRITPEQALAEARTVIPPELPADRAALGQWLNRLQLGAYTLDLIDPAMALTRRDLLEARVDALVQQRAWRELVTLLETPDVPVTEVPRQLALAQAYTQLGDDRAFTRTRERLMIAAGRDADTLRQIAERGASLGLPSITIPALKRLAEQPARAEWAYRQLYSIAKQQGDFAGVRQALDHLKVSRPDQLEVVNDWAYFQLVAGAEPKPILQALLPLFEAQPENLYPRLTCAWALCRAGRPTEGLQLLRAVNDQVDWTTLESRQQLMFALVLQANNLPGLAREHAARVVPAQLLTEERTLLASIR